MTMRNLGTLTISAFACALLLGAQIHPAPVVHAQEAPPAVAIDVQALGPQVGARVPAFRLSDQRGQVQTLQSVMGPKGAILVFFRSADW